MPNYETVCRLAHLTDLHMGPLPEVKITDLFSKRILGYMSWMRGRRFRHRADILERIVEDVAEQEVDHKLLTGDLVNISLRKEFEAAARWLEGVGTPDNMTVIPGNHDAYVKGAAENNWKLWRAFMAGDEKERVQPYPFVKRIKGAAIIGLSSAIPTGWREAAGALGDSQLLALDETLARLKPEDGLRIVLIHHPPIDAWSRKRKRLRDGAAFRAIIQRRGAELILCGHEHILMMGTLPGPRGDVPVFCSPSASVAGGPGKGGGGYLLFELQQAKGARGANAPYRLSADYRRLNVDDWTVGSAFKANFERTAADLPVDLSKVA
ncbi:3',5'-cyclic AMP phosphodiesterase CpdA [Arboricoccus pini]|uniref:3',5'-cyclic AMP phosphodiesterase CpdA n=1 Tax=Arboricoccus pini TaxID=1963835 RepID=A0A212QN34_9PROT|nr:metallophosphoesterase [Arboricoccus pini]SNB60648.1 3',5'-cyclic AMP phosphodiesterase CpdA [Arboricoccus pini]